MSVALKRVIVTLTPEEEFRRAVETEMRSADAAHARVNARLAEKLREHLDRLEKPQEATQTPEVPEQA
jgi:hypothetical protein